VRAAARAGDKLRNVLKVAARFVELGKPGPMGGHVNQGIARERIEHGRRGTETLGGPGSVFLGWYGHRLGLLLTLSSP
jgi:hypothetical protein